VIQVTHAHTHTHTNTHKSPLNAKVKLLTAEILYLTVHYKNNGDDENKRTINLSNVPRKHKIKELQKTAILGTARILQKVLTYTYKILNMESYIPCCINSYYRIAATLYTLETRFVSSI